MRKAPFTQVSIPREVHRQLKLISAITGESMSAILQRLVRYEMAENHDIYAAARRMLDEANNQRFDGAGLS